LTWFCRSLPGRPGVAVGLPPVEVLDVVVLVVVVELDVVLEVEMVVLDVVLDVVVVEVVAVVEPGKH
jgi:hypothetical protein